MTGFSDDEYAVLEHAAYEAAVVPELWPDVLATLGEMTGTAGGSFACLNERGAHIVCPSNMDGARERILTGGYLNRSGRAQGVISKGLMGTPRFLNEYDYYDDITDVDKDPIVTDCFRAEGFGWAAGWVSQLPHGDLVIMNVEQYYDRGPIIGEALNRLDSVYSIFARAAFLSERADFQKTRAAVETLEGLQLPAVAVTPTGRAVFANDHFSQVPKIWTTRAEEKVGLTDKVAQEKLEECLATIERSVGPRSIPVREQDGGPVVGIIQVVPIRRTAHDVFGSAAAILVLSQKVGAVAEATLIQTLYDLTPAEIAVARGIANGLSIANIAQSTGKSHLTIRSQLQSVMSKTGCRRQVELALLIRQLSQPSI